VAPNAFEHLMPTTDNAISASSLLNQILRHGSNKLECVMYVDYGMMTPIES